jgi:hypothetical protein
LVTRDRLKDICKIIRRGTDGVAAVPAAGGNAAVAAAAGRVPANSKGETGTTDYEYFFVSQVTVVSKSKCKSFTNLVKDSETFTNLVKDLETFTNLVKDLETFTNLVKDSESFTKSGTEF